MKKLITILLLISASSAFGQKTFRVDGFSEQFFGKVHFDKPSDVFSPGWVGIFNKPTKQQLIKVESGELTHFEVEGEAKANIAQRPYGFQSDIFSVLRTIGNRKVIFNRNKRRVRGIKKVI